MADVENGQEIDPLQDENVADFDADAEVSLDETGDSEVVAGQDTSIEDPVRVLLV